MLITNASLPTEARLGQFAARYRYHVKALLDSAPEMKPKEIHRAALDSAYKDFPEGKSALSAYCGLAHKHRPPETETERLGLGVFKAIGRIRRDLIPGSFSPRKKRPVLAEAPKPPKPESRKHAAQVAAARYKDVALSVGRLPSDKAAAILLGISRPTVCKTRLAMTGEGFVFTRTSKREWIVNRAPGTKPLAAPEQLALAPSAELPPGLAVTTREVAPEALGITPEAMAALAKPGAMPLAAVAFPPNLGDVMAKALEAALAEAMKTAVANVMAAANQPR